MEAYFEMAVTYLASVQWYWILAFAFFITMLENLFPPSPSDAILVFTGTLVGLGNIGFVGLLLSATLGSTVGFLIMYYLGYRFDKKISKAGKFSFITPEIINKLEKWFQKWGYFLIVANRFLSGTRAVISFFAGISKLSISKTTVLSAISALVWNAILIYLGTVFGQNWRAVLEYMTLYGQIILPAVVVVIIIVVLWWYFKTYKKQDSNTSQE